MASLVVLCGPPGAGKSTYAKGLRMRVLTADAIREGADPARTIAALHRELDACLARGESCVVDTCSLLQVERLRLLRMGRKAHARCELHRLDTPMHECRRRDGARAYPAKVSWHAVRQHAERTAFQLALEPWDEVRIVNGGYHG